MVKTIKLSESKFQVTDSQVFFGRNDKGAWEVYDAARQSVIANYLNDYDWAECVAFEYVCKVG